VILREQMAAIQRQLGEGDGRAQEVQELTEKLAKANMPPEVEVVLLRKNGGPLMQQEDLHGQVTEALYARLSG
jgi:ATP-dependent Lon protease